MRERNLFDYPALCVDREAAPLRKNLSRSAPLIDRVELKEGDSVLHLGCGDGRLSRRMLDLGCELLGMSEWEEEVVTSRKNGVRAVLGMAEYLDDRERFDWIVLESTSYRFYEPVRALERMVGSLRRGGRAILEFPVDGNLAFLGEALERVAEHLDLSRTIGKPEWIPAEHYREVLKRLEAVEAQPSLHYRNEILTTEKLEGWLGPYLRMTIPHLAPEERRRFVDMLRQHLHDLQKEEGMIVAEYVLLRLGMTKR